MGTSPLLRDNGGDAQEDERERAERLPTDALAGEQRAERDGEERVDIGVAGRERWSHRTHKEGESAVADDGTEHHEVEQRGNGARRRQFGADRKCSATRQGWSKGIGGGDAFMKLCSSSSGCKARLAKGEPAQAGSEPCDGLRNGVGEA